MTVEEWAKRIVVPPEVMFQTLEELKRFDICYVRFRTVTERNSHVTLVSRRMIREEKERESNRIRQRRFRANAHITPSQHAILESESESESELEKKKSKRAAGPPPRGTVFPEAFNFDERADALAKSYGLNPFKELAAFRDHHVSKGTVFRDWQAAFRTWLRHAVQYAQKGPR